MRISNDRFSIIDNIWITLHVIFPNHSHMILQLGILFCFLALGELVIYLTGLPIPSSIIGMVLLAASLKCGIIKLIWVDKAADFLLKNLGFFFVPAGIGLMNCMGLIADQWLPITCATIISTWVVLAVTGHMHQQILRRRNKKS